MMLAALLESAKKVHHAFTWGFPIPPEEPDFVTKVEQRKCWRNGCKQQEYSEVGLCIEHIREAKSW
jgi:hypothetical protein